MVGIDGIKAFTSQLRRAKWPSGFSPKGIKTYDEDRDPEAFIFLLCDLVKIPLNPRFRERPLEVVDELGTEISLGID